MLATCFERYLTSYRFRERALRLFSIVLIGGFLSGPQASHAARKEKTPEPLEEVGVSERLDAQVPLDLKFRDSNGDPVTLGDYFDGDRPVLLTMNYSDCPMLCSLQLNGLFEGLGRMRWDIGDEFQMITVSIDPLETPQRAKLTKQKYLKMYGRPGVASGWHCVVGSEESIRKLADTVGFGFNYDPVSKQYGHAAVTMVLTPEGHVSRYLYGVEYDPQTLRLSLLEASDGKIGTTTDQIILYCFQYDAESGRYAPAAFRIMQAGSILTVVALGGVLLVFWRRESRPPGETAKGAAASGAAESGGEAEKSR